MLADRYGSDYDYAEAHGNGRRDRSPGPAGPSLTPAEMAAEVRRICGPALDRLRGVTQSAHRCRHGVDLERAGCGRCLSDSDICRSAAQE